MKALQTTGLFTVFAMCVWGCLYGLGAIALTPITFLSTLGLIFLMFCLNVTVTGVTVTMVLNTMTKEIFDDIKGG